MTSKTNTGLVEYSQKALSEKWGYVWGTYGQILTESLFQAKLKQYPDGVGNYKDFIQSHWLNRKVTDCVGLIKSYMWCDGEKINYTAATDLSADGMYSKAKEKGLINTIPDIPGTCLWKKGHVGVYIGGGYVIESHGTKYGVIKTPLKGGTAWTNWFKCPYIEYETVQTKIEKVVDNMDVKLLQHTLNKLDIKGKDGKVLTEDGISGENTNYAKATLKSLLTEVLK